MVLQVDIQLVHLVRWDHPDHQVQCQISPLDHHSLCLKGLRNLQFLPMVTFLLNSSQLVHLVDFPVVPLDLLVVSLDLPVVPLDPLVHPVVIQCHSNLPHPWVHLPCRRNLSSHPCLWEVPLHQCLKVYPHKWDLPVQDIAYPLKWDPQVQDLVCLQVLLDLV